MSTQLGVAVASRPRLTPESLEAIQNRSEAPCRPREARKVRITRAWLEGIPLEPQGQVTYSDTSLPGFRVIVGKTAKSFAVEKLVGHRVVKHTFAKYPTLTVELARREAQKLLGRLATGEDLNESKRVAISEAKGNAITLEEAFGDFIQARSLRPNTQDDYRRSLERGLPEFWKKPIRAITREMVLAQHTRIGKKDKHEPFANGVMRVLGSVMNFSRAKGLITDNPVQILSDTRAWFEEKRRTSYIKPHQLGAVQQAIRTIRSDNAFPAAAVGTDYIEFLLHTGLRRDECATLRWANIDRTGRTITIPGAKTKNGNEHVLPLTNSLIEILDRRQFESPKSPWVFESPVNSRHGYLYDPRTVIEAITEHCGVSFTCHDLRRTFVTIANQIELSYPTQKRLLNHAIGSDVTLGYVQVSHERLVDAMCRIESFILAHSKESPNALRLTA